jgi:hypothetical protein
VNGNVLQVSLEFNISREQRISDLRRRFKQFQKFRMRQLKEVAEENGWRGNCNKRAQEWDVRKDVDSWRCDGE